MNDNDSPLGKPHFAECVCVTCEQQKAEAMTERTVEQMCSVWQQQLPSPQALAEDWYNEQQIVNTVTSRFAGPIPRDVTSPEFGKWIAHEYRLAMAKGIELERRRVAAQAEPEDLATLRLDAERWRKHAASVVSGLKHIGPFKRKNGDDPHPLDCTLAGRVSHVFGVGMTSAISLCREFGQDPEWRE